MEYSSGKPNFKRFNFSFSAEVLDEANRIYTKEDDRFLGLKLRACVKPKKVEEKVDKRVETPNVENEKNEKLKESEIVDRENSKEDDEEIEKSKNEEKAENVEKVEKVKNKKSENVDDEKAKDEDVEKVENEDLELDKSEMKNAGDEEVHGDADEIINKIKEWYQEGNFPRTIFSILENSGPVLNFGCSL